MPISTFYSGSEPVACFVGDAIIDEAVVTLEAELLFFYLSVLVSAILILKSKPSNYRKRHKLVSLTSSAMSDNYYSL